MSYAIRNDGQGWRAVDGPDDVMADETFAETIPAPSLGQVQAAQIGSLTVSYNAAIQLPVAYMGTTFQADSGSQDTLNKSLVALGGTVPAGFYWVAADNGQVSMTFTQLQGLAGAMMAQGWAAFQHLQAQKALVNAATTVAAAQAVIW